MRKLTLLLISYSSVDEMTTAANAQAQTQTPKMNLRTGRAFRKKATAVADHDDDGDSGSGLDMTRPPIDLSDELIRRWRHCRLGKGTV